MSSNINSVPPFLGGSVRGALESIGITQFPNETSWYQILGGLVIQGGVLEVADGATVTVPLNAPYEKQLLGTWIQTVGATENGAYIIAPLPQVSFDIINGAGIRSYYWISIGV